MPTRCRLTAVTSLALAVLIFSGCSGKAPSEPQGDGTPPLSAEESKASQELRASLSDLISEATVRFRPLDYEYDEDLLKVLDRVEQYLSGKTPGPPPREMPKLDEEEEVEHFRETIRRWNASTGKDLRTEVAKLKADVDARKPDGPRFHPDFHKRFGAAFDDLIPIEVVEIRERRNRYLHEKAKLLFDKYRADFPDLVTSQEALLDQPPYNLPEASPEAKINK